MTRCCSCCSCGRWFPPKKVEKEKEQLEPRCQKCTYIRVFRGVNVLKSSCAFVFFPTLQQTARNSNLMMFSYSFRLFLDATIEPLTLLKQFHSKKRMSPFLLRITTSILFLLRIVFLRASLPLHFLSPIPPPAPSIGINI